ncbi:MAG: Myb-like DNA-binding domain-containing protein [bacterium]
MPSWPMVFLRLTGSLLPSAAFAESYLPLGPNGERMTAEGMPHKTGIWTDAEDELLYMWQQRIGNKWSEVAKHIPGKSGQQCAQRWRHRVNPNIKRDKWNKLEDALLIRLVELYGNQWALIARNVPGRTDQQCMGRWRRHLDPTIRRERWKPEEDILLCALWKKYGNSWSQISKGMEGRTPQQCRTRHQHIEVNMQVWMKENEEVINGLDVSAYERSRGLDGYVGARNAKHIVMKEAVEMRDRAALISSKLRAAGGVIDVEMLEADQMDEMTAGGIPSEFSSQARDVEGERGSAAPHDPPDPTSKPPQHVKEAGRGVLQPRMSPSAAIALPKREEVDVGFDTELPSFMPVDIAKVLRDSKLFLAQFKPKPLSVESFQPTAALRLNEMSETGAGWGSVPIVSQMNLQPFQPFKDFAPFQMGTAGPTREVGIGVNGAKVLGGFEKPTPVVKPATLHKKRIEPSASIRNTALNNQPTGRAPPADSADGQPWDVDAAAKRPRHTFEDCPNPDLEEERRLREEGGRLQKAREEEMMAIIRREGVCN